MPDSVKEGKNKLSVEGKNKLSVEGKNKLSVAESRLPTLSDGNSSTRSRSKIQSVPRILRSHHSISEKYFEPRVLAMGPIHHGKCEEAEELKYTLAADFIQDSGRTSDYLYQKIKENINDIKDCYDKEITKCHESDDDDIAWMLFIDGCSTLQFIHKYDTLEKFGMNTTQVAFARLDLFLLENQLPNQVLKLLIHSISSTTVNEQLYDNIQHFVGMQIIAAEKPLERKIMLDKKHDVEKLNVRQQVGIIIVAAILESPAAKRAMYNEMYDESTHLLDFLRRRMLSSSPEIHDDGQLKQDHSPSFRNAQELKATGVHFRRSKTGSLKDVSFTSRCFSGFVGFLNLPPINEDAMSLFLNLIAYEMCPDFKNDFTVTSYFGFLSSLIAHPEDAKQLRSARILCNLRGSDEALAELFHEIGPDLVLAHPMYKSINAKLEQHYKTKWKAWFAQFLEDHFSSPWAVLAFIGALIVLILSGIQTWYTVLSFYQK